MGSAFASTHTYLVRLSNLTKRLDEGLAFSVYQENKMATIKMKKGTVYADIFDSPETIAQAQREGYHICMDEEKPPKANEPENHLEPVTDEPSTQPEPDTEQPEADAKQPRRGRPPRQNESE